MKITRQTIEHLANLARLNLTEAESAMLEFEFQKIVTFADKLNELDLTGIQPMEHVIPIKNLLREDIVCKSFDRDVLLKNAPSSENGCYKVPKVLE